MLCSPAFGGNLCNGSSREYEVCNTDVCLRLPQHTYCYNYSYFQPCPNGTRNFRDVQCSATDGVSFNGRFHAWEVFTGQGMHANITVFVEDNNWVFLCCTVPPQITPCQLVCQADKGEVVAVRANAVIDGTTCTSDDSPFAVCIQGVCTVSE